MKVKSWKFKVALLGLLLLPAGALFAEPPKDDGGWMSDSEKQEWKQKAELRHQKRIEKLAKELNLTAEQKGKISGIMKEGWEKISAEREKMRDIAKSIRQETDSQIEKLLNPEQIEKFRQHRKEMEKKFKEHFKKWRKHMSEPE